MFIFVFLEIDECTSKIHNCDRNALCKNTEGSFSCTCKTGYKGDGKKCRGNFKNRSNALNHYNQLVRPTSNTSIYACYSTAVLEDCIFASVIAFIWNVE